jgi:hypothetical protein
MASHPQEPLALERPQKELLARSPGSGHCEIHPIEVKYDGHEHGNLKRMFNKELEHDEEL